MLGSEPLKAIMSAINPPPPAASKVYGEVIATEAVGQ